MYIRQRVGYLILRNQYKMLLLVHHFVVASRNHLKWATSSISQYDQQTVVIEIKKATKSEKGI